MVVDGSAPAACLPDSASEGRSFHEFEHGAPLSTPTAVQALVERQCHVVGDVIRSHSRDRVARHAPPEYPVDTACSSLPRTGSATRSSKPSSARDARAAVEVASLAASSTPRRVRVLRIMFPCDVPLAPVQHLLASCWLDNVEACIAQRLDDTQSSCPKAWSDFPFMRWRQLTDS